MKKRIMWIDIARGIAMLSVVVGHSLYNYSDGTLGRYIYAVHMPIFFLLSGYLYREKSFGEEAHGTMRNLVMPYYFTALLMIAMYSLAGIPALQGGINANFTPSLVDLVSAVFYGAGFVPRLPFANVTIFACGVIWFLLALAISLLVFNYIIVKTKNLKQKNVVRMILVIFFAALSRIVSIYWLLPLSINAALFSLVFLYCGYLMREHDFLSAINNWMLLAGLCAWVLVANIQKLNLSSVDMNDALLTLAGAIGGTIVVVKVSQWLENTVFFSSVLTTIGKYSIIFLCFHQLDLVFSNVPTMIMNATFTDNDILKICVVIVYRMIVPLMATVLVPVTPGLKSIYLNRSFPFKFQRSTRGN